MLYGHQEYCNLSVSSYLSEKKSEIFEKSWECLWGVVWRYSIVLHVLFFEFVSRHNVFYLKATFLVPFCFIYQFPMSASVLTNGILWMTFGGVHTRRYAPRKQNQHYKFKYIYFYIMRFEEIEWEKFALSSVHPSLSKVTFTIT